eukprot:6203685-Pleurochrysis_carterae.AAC.2
MSYTRMHACAAHALAARRTQASPHHSAEILLACTLDVWLLASSLFKRPGSAFQSLTQPWKLVSVRSHQDVCTVASTSVENSAASFLVYRYEKCHIYGAMHYDRTDLNKSTNNFPREVYFFKVPNEPYHTMCRPCARRAHERLVTAAAG